MRIANLTKTTGFKAPARSKTVAAAIAVATAAALMAGCDGATIEVNSDDGNTSVRSFGAGVHLTDSAKVQDVGLPLYPGAKPDKKKKSNGESDSDSVNLSAWGGAFGFKLVVVSLESDDSPEKVAAFYQDKLAKYGTVLECKRDATGSKKKSLRLGKSEDEKRTKKRADGPITCDDETINQEGIVYRAGTRGLQRAAAVQSRNGGSTFQLVMVEKRGLD